MKLDKELIKKVAKNARLNLTENEIEKFTKECSDILNTFSKIEEVDTKNIEPAFHPIPIKNHLREDLIEDSLSQDDALKNAKHQINGYFKGPKAI
ncbi:MAG: Asp-tRNA(Asn)/Glu-tRNA(Gln) amidotransferase subunit GatC [Candidatus Nanoarchaeia archaeon]|nr:Asp-tRNA(Asn)/Glu-tRNA(Gln) amidotransferase subunit GatC [Candidatus Nanoarchaeia archaeon]